jgi:hypothetical protein
MLRCAHSRRPLICTQSCPWDATWRYFSSQGWKRIGILSLTDASGQAGEKYIANLDRKYGMDAVASERFAPADINVTAQITQILASMHGFAGSNGYDDFRVRSDRGLTIRDVVVVRSPV